MAFDITTSLIKLNNQYTIVGSANGVDPTTKPKKGELYFGPVNNGIRTCKIGDGETEFQNLPFLGINPANGDTFGTVKSGGDVNITEGIINLKTSGVTAGTYRSVTVNDKGIVTGGSDTDANTNYYHTRSYNTGLKISTGTGVSDMYVPTATSSLLGVVKPAAVRTSTVYTTTGHTTSDRYYGVELDSSGKMFVNVPWSSGSGADGNTTYSISKAGSTITLTGSDGTTSSVTDSNTTYTHPSAPTSASTTCSGQEAHGSSSGIGLISNVSVGINNTGHVADVTLEYASATVGGSTYGMYVENGIIKPGSKYAGGTKITLNGVDKGGSSVTFYAPTGAGTSGQFLQSTGSGAPTWNNISSIIPTQIYISGTPRSATFSGGVLSFS